MKNGREAQSTAPGKRRRGNNGSWIPVALSAGAVWLGWQIVLAPVTQRAPPGLVARIAPDSMLTLSRAAESELAAGRSANADFLARRRLAQAPFDVRALRVAGLAADKAGHADKATEILTLAGNWSLRDDPAHAWLIDRSLKQGDYVTAFAHADTLVRRREDIRPQVFSLFTEAASSDPRALPSVVKLLGAAPPWAEGYFVHLYETPRGLQLATNLALGMQQAGTPLPDAELRRLYYELAYKTGPANVVMVRTRLRRPLVPTGFVIRGDFEDAFAVEPFNWRMMDVAGLMAEIVPAPDQGQMLSVVYQGYGAGHLVDQLLTLPGGDYVLSGLASEEGETGSSQLNWKIICTEASKSRIAPGASETASSPRAGWRRFSLSFTVPASGCEAQWLSLEASITDRSRVRSASFDDLKINRR